MLQSIAHVRSQGCYVMSKQMLMQCLDANGAAIVSMCDIFVAQVLVSRYVPCSFLAVATK